MDALPASPSAAPPTPQAGFALVEKRVVEFHPPALRMAMESAGVQLYGLPRLPVTGMALLPQEAAARFRLGTGAAATDHVIEGPRLVAMLIGYCIGAGVPLPNAASKTLRVHEAFVEVRFTVGYANAPLPSRAAPGRKPEAAAWRSRPGAGPGG